MKRGGQAVLIVLVVVGLYFRGSGLFRGIGSGVIFHPDAPKQVLMLHNYLHGRYIQYYDCVYYDGYPYGLNRVDELIIRAVQWVRRPFHVWLFPEEPFVATPHRADLYGVGRALRVLYGLTAILLIYLSVRMANGPPGAALGAAACYSLAPLASTVTHSVTGDVGVDVFLALSLFFMSLHARTGHSIWIAAFGASCGMAFACKFQGLMGLWVGLAAFIPPSRMGMFRAMRWLGRRTAFLVAGVVAGAVFLNPALLLAPKRTLRDIRLNIDFIRQYGASPELLDQPLLNRIGSAFRQNAPVVVSSLGVMLLVLSVIACALGAIAVFRRRRCAAGPDAGRFLDNAEQERRWSFFVFATASFPCLALIVSLILKPVVQPFHFSFLLPAAATSVGMALSLGYRSRWARFARRSLAVFVAIALIELAWKSIEENYFWRRPETAGAAYAMARDLFVVPAGATRANSPVAVKHFFLEPSTLPVFRNRFSSLEHHGLLWEQNAYPVPSIPLPGDRYWLFINGRVFPRNDRMFLAGRRARDRGGETVSRVAVFDARPERIILGLRTGRFPSRYAIDVAGCAPVRGLLLPNSQAILTFMQPYARRFSGVPEYPSAYHVAIDVSVELGPLWCAVLVGQDALTQYVRFGPNPSGDAAGPPEWTPSQTEALARDMKSFRYIESSEAMTLDADRWKPLAGFSLPLPAGVYRFEAEIVNRGDAAATLNLATFNASAPFIPIHAFEARLPPGSITNVIRQIEKPFAPYEIDLSARGDETIVIHSWTLRPDIEALATWAPRNSERNVPLPDAPKSAGAIVYPGLGVFRELVFKEPPRAGRPLRYWVRFDLDPAIAHRDFHEAIVFLHLLNERNEIVAALDYPLTNTWFSDDAINAREAAPVPAGRYRVIGGIYNGRTRKRFAYRREDRPAAEARRRFVTLIDSLEVAP